MDTMIRSLSGKPVGYFDGGDALRDVNGKPVALRSGTDKDALTLTDLAAAWGTGKQVLMDLGVGEVRAPTAAVADFGIPMGDFVADVASPVKIVDHERGSWWNERVSDELQPATALVVSSGASPSEIEPGFGNLGFVCVPYGLAARLPRRIVANADFHLKPLALRRIMQALKLGREMRVSNLLATSANWAAGNVIALGATAKWNSGTTAAPLLDLFKAIKASYLTPTTLVLTQETSQYFYANATSTLLRDFIQSGGTMPKIVEAKAKQLVSGAPAYVWGTGVPVNAVLVREPESDVDMCTSRTFRWLGDKGVRDGGAKEGFLVRQFSDDLFDYVLALHSDAELFLSNQVGAVITGVIQ